MNRSALRNTNMAMSKPPSKQGKMPMKGGPKGKSAGMGAKSGRNSAPPMKGGKAGC